VREERTDGAVKVIKKARRETWVAALDGEHAFPRDRIHDDLEKKDVAAVALFGEKTAIRNSLIDDQ